MIVLKDVRFIELKALLNYMYRGEVNISQDYLSQLIKTAENLQIRGLADSGTIRKKSPNKDEEESPVHKKPKKNRRQSGQSGSSASVVSVEPEPEQEDSDVDFDETSLDKLSSPPENEVSDEPLNLELTSEKRTDNNYNQNSTVQKLQNLETMSVTSSSCDNVIGDSHDSAKNSLYFNKGLDILKIPMKEEILDKSSVTDIDELSPFHTTPPSDPADVSSSNDLSANLSTTLSSESKYKTIYHKLYSNFEWLSSISPPVIILKGS